MAERTEDRPVVMLSGGKTTLPLAKPLDARFKVAVLDQNAVQSILSAGVDEVLCPAKGAGTLLGAQSANDAALLIGKIVGNLQRIGPRFSLNGSSSGKAADKVGDWLPGLAASMLPQLTFDVRTLAAMSASADIRAVVTHEDVTPRFRALVLWAKARGIPTVHVPHANHFIRTRPDIHDGCLCEWLLAASPWMRDWYAERGYPADRIEVVGNPTWDKWVKVNETVDRRHARAVLQLSQDVPVLMYCTSWPQTTNVVDDHDLWETANAAVLKAAKGRSWQLVWSLHPGDHASWRVKYANMAKDAGVPAVVVQGHLELTLRAADAVLAVGPSNVLVEAGLAGTPPLTIPLRGYGFAGEPPWTARATATGIKDRVGWVLAHPEAWDEARAAFVERYARNGDAGAVARAVEFVGGLAA